VGIEINYQDFIPTPYFQLGGAFMPNLSILDWWMNTK